MALGKELGRIPAGLHPPGHSSGAAAGSLSSTAGDSSQEGTVTLDSVGQGEERPLGAHGPAEREMLNSCSQNQARGFPRGFLPGSVLTPALGHCCLGALQDPQPLCLQLEQVQPANLAVAAKTPTPNPQIPVVPALTPERSAAHQGSRHQCSRGLALKNPKSNVPHGCPEEMQIPGQL